MQSLLFVICLSVLSCRAWGRTNFCNEANHVRLTGNHSLFNALTGKEIVVAVRAQDLTPFYLNANLSNVHINKIITPTSGYMYDLQTAIAKQGGFKFVYKIVKDAGKFASYTDYIRYAMGVADFVADDIYSDTVTRRALGIGFTAEVADSSFILLTKTFYQPPQQNLFSFLLPFTNELWWLIAMSIVFNALMRMYIDIWYLDQAHTKKVGMLVQSGKSEKLPEPPNRLEEGLKRFRKYLYKSWGSFTTMDGMEAENKGLSSTLMVGYTFLMLVIGASYTANLASTLFYAPPFSSLPVKDMSDANTRSLRICVPSGSAAFQAVKQLYPKVYPIQVSNSGFAEFDQGLCVGNVVQLADWERALTDPVGNDICDWVQVDTIRHVSGGWAHAGDYSQNCTTFAKDVLSTIITNMTLYGDVQKQWAASLAKIPVGKRTCPERAIPSQALTVEQMAGAFIFYGACVAFVVLMTFLKWLFPSLEKVISYFDCTERAESITPIPAFVIRGCKADSKLGEEPDVVINVTHHHEVEKLTYTVQRHAHDGADVYQIVVATDDIHAVLVALTEEVAEDMHSPSALLCKKVIEEFCAKVVQVVDKAGSAPPSNKVKEETELAPPGSVLKLDHHEILNSAKRCVGRVHSFNLDDDVWRGVDWE